MSQRPESQEYARPVIRRGDPGMRPGSDVSDPRYSQYSDVSLGQRGDSRYDGYEDEPDFSGIAGVQFIRRKERDEEYDPSMDPESGWIGRRPDAFYKRYPELDPDAMPVESPAGPPPAYNECNPPPRQTGRQGGRQAGRIPGAQPAVLPMPDDRAPEPTTQVQVQRAPPPQQSQTRIGTVVQPQSYKIFSIVTIFVNFLFGLAGLYYSMQSEKSFHEEKNMRKAKDMGRMAYFLDIIGVITSLAIVFIVILSVAVGQLSR